MIWPTSKTMKKKNRMNPDGDGFYTGPWWEDLVGFSLLVGPFLIIGIIDWWINGSL